MRAGFSSGTSSGVAEIGSAIVFDKMTIQYYFNAAVGAISAAVKSSATLTAVDNFVRARFTAAPAATSVGTKKGGQAGGTGGNAGSSSGGGSSSASGSGGGGGSTGGKGASATLADVTKAGRSPSVKMM